MVAQVVLDESCDEKIAVVVTLLHAQLQGIVTGDTGMFQGAGFQLVDQVFTFLLAICGLQTLREFCVNQSCTVMHCSANRRIGQPGNSLIIKSKGLHLAD